jgi:integrase
LEVPRQPILKSGRKWSVRILRPQEYTQIWQHGALMPQNKVFSDVLLYTGMRYVEAKRLRENPNWLDGASKFIHLPPTAILKAKRRQLDRWIRLNGHGVQAVERFLQGRQLPVWETWTLWMKEWAQRAGLDPVGMGPKTLRKTWESWLVSIYPERLPEITMSQGHTVLTSVAHYLNMPFTAEDKAAIRPYVEGMF